VYRSAACRERREAHGALAAATDPEIDPDRRAWHRAHATTGPDEDVATDLERTAARAKSRGGLAAAAAFLERAATLTPDAGKRAQRVLAAATVMYEAGGYEAVDNLLRRIDTSQLDELGAARIDRLRAVVALSAEGPGKEPILRLLDAAQRLRQLDPELGRAALLEEVPRLFDYASKETLEAVLEAFEESSASPSGELAELLLLGWARLVRQGFPAGTDLLRAAVLALREKPSYEDSDLPLLAFSCPIAGALWDLEGWKKLAGRAVQLARDAGALQKLPFALGTWSLANVCAGDFHAAAAAVAESQAVQEATNASRIETGTAWLDAWRLSEPEALERIDLDERSHAKPPVECECARAIAYNGAGRYEAALAAAERSCERHPAGSHAWALVELVEAAVRCGHGMRASGALEQLIERTQLAGTDWGLGLEARSRALASEDPIGAETSYRESIDFLRRAGARPDLGRAHLVYGEWLRRQNRRIDAREQLRTAIDLFDEMGIPGFADRARRELAATGETARKRTDDTRADLTGQEAQIARLALQGLTNPQIGAQLFLSPRTVEWHLRRIYPKLGISSRKELHTAISSS
jgi:ATP/maltotriose-dependent transcriptional regulator MalT